MFIFFIIFIFVGSKPKPKAHLSPTRFIGPFSYFLGPLLSLSDQAQQVNPTSLHRPNTALSRESPHPRRLDCSWFLRMACLASPVYFSCATCIITLATLVCPLVCMAPARHAPSSCLPRIKPLGSFPQCLLHVASTCTFYSSGHAMLKPTAHRLQQFSFPSKLRQLWQQIPMHSSSPELVIFLCMCQLLHQSIILVHGLLARKPAMQLHHVPS